MAFAVTDVYETSIGNRILHTSDRNSSAMLIKEYRAKPISFKMVKYRLAKRFKRPIPIEYLRPADRREFEKTCLTLWWSKGFRVPAVIPVPPEFADREPCLAIEYIHGERLDAYFQHPDRSTAQKLAILKTIYADMHVRHRIAIFENEHRLIHYDVNIRNVIIQDGQPFHIDFEMGHLSEPIERSAAREVLLLGLETANHLGSTHIAAITKQLVSNYAITPILRRIVKDVLKTPFQTIHRKRDRNRKRQHPGLVTKYDLASAIECALMALTGKRSSHEVTDTCLEGGV
jgi:tRNA A-37 threonylcarbamoyl transferase component Bud32